MIRKFNNRIEHLHDDSEQLHNENGPALEYIAGKQKGYKAWYINGLSHREDGAAHINPNGQKFYFFKGKFCRDIKSDEEWIKFVKVLKLLG